MKKSRNKYRLDARGELMLIHECIECRTLSINRSAADDEVESMMRVFQESLEVGGPIPASLQLAGIRMLTMEDAEALHSQLRGHYAEISQGVWA